MSLQFIGGQFKKQTTTASPHCPYLTFPFSPTFSTVFSSITPFLTRRMRFKNFNSIYWMLAPIKILSRNEELAFDDCKRILDYLKGSLEQQVPHHHQRDWHHHHHHLDQVDGDSPIVKDWALGKKHVFLTEGTRQHLERLRTEKRNASVTLIQSGILPFLIHVIVIWDPFYPFPVWRGFSARKKWPALRRGLQSHFPNCQSQHQRTSKPSRPRPQVRSLVDMQTAELDNDVAADIWNSATRVWGSRSWLPAHRQRKSKWGKAGRCSWVPRPVWHQNNTEDLLPLRTGSGNSDFHF